MVDIMLQQPASVFSTERVAREKALDRLRLGDIIFRHLTRAAAVAVLLLLTGVIVSLIIGSLPAINKFGLNSWFPASGMRWLTSSAVCLRSTAQLSPR